MRLNAVWNVYGLTIADSKGLRDRIPRRTHTRSSLSEDEVCGGAGAQSHARKDSNVDRADPTAVSASSEGRAFNISANFRHIKPVWSPYPLKKAQPLSLKSK